MAALGNLSELVGGTYDSQSRSLDISLYFLLATQNGYGERRLREVLMRDMELRSVAMLKLGKAHFKVNCAK